MTTEMRLQIVSRVYLLAFMGLSLFIALLTVDDEKHSRIGNFLAVFLFLAGTIAAAAVFFNVGVN